MGEIADMMLEGILCEGCGGYLGDGHGFPGLCGDCAKEWRAAGQKIRDTKLGYYQDVTPIPADSKPNPEKTNCPECGKRVKKVGLKAHMQVVHNA